MKAYIAAADSGELGNSQRKELIISHKEAMIEYEGIDGRAEMP
jgi:hypothetical protein